MTSEEDEYVLEDLELSQEEIENCTRAYGDCTQHLFGEDEEDSDGELEPDCTQHSVEDVVDNNRGKEWPDVEQGQNGGDETAERGEANEAGAPQKVMAHPESEKRKMQQSTLSQFFNRNKRTKRTRTEESPRGEEKRPKQKSEDEVIMDYGIFKKGESFQHRPGKKWTGREILTIQSFGFDNKGFNFALCIVSIPLCDTMLDSDRSRDIKESHLQTEYVQICVGTKAPNALDLFAGAGGFSTGLRDAGVVVEAAVEVDDDVCATLLNNHHCTLYHVDVWEFLDRVKKKLKGYPKCGQYNHIHASSPCKGCSAANRTRGKGKNDLSNNELSLAFPRAIRLLLPDTATFENVTGILLPDTFVYVQMIVVKLIVLGYQVRVAVVDSSNYGDPQKRQRVIIFAAKKGHELPEFPQPTHGREGAEPVQTVRMALKDLENIPPREDIDHKNKGHIQLADGSVITNHTLNKKTKYSEMKELKADEPAMTLTTSNEFQHYSEKRGLTIREYARLQSFPDDYHFIGKRGNCRKQIGNAVPIALATAVARSVISSYVDTWIAQTPKVKAGDRSQRKRHLRG